MSPKKRGLPDSIKMRHDFHFVEEITADTTPQIVRKIPIEKLIFGEFQPREDIGEIDELIASIKEQGIIEPVIVRAKGEKYEIIAGERRVKAAKEAGLKEVPCIEMEVADDKALELSLVENIQRKDLSPFEEAFALKKLNVIFGYTQEEIAKKIGKSRSSVAETIKIASLPKRVIEIAKKLKIESKSFLLELSKLESEEEMLKAIKAYEEGSLTRDDLRKKRKSEGEVENKRKPLTFQFVSPKKDFKIKIQIKKEEISKDELIKILEDLLQSIKESKELPFK